MKKNILPFLIGTLLLLSSCSRFDDGPLFSLQTANKRIEKSWVVDQYLYNGFDDLEYYDSIYPHSYMVFRSGGTYEFVSDSIYLKGSWRWSSNSEQGNDVLIIDAIDILDTNMIIQSRVMEVTRLKNEELWFKEYPTGVVLEYRCIPR